MGLDDAILEASDKGGRPLKNSKGAGRRRQSTIKDAFYFASLKQPDRRSESNHLSIAYSSSSFSTSLSSANAAPVAKNVVRIANRRVNWNKPNNAAKLAEAVLKVKSKELSQGQAESQYGISQSIISKASSGARSGVTGGVHVI